MIFGVYALSICIISVSILLALCDSLSASITVVLSPGNLARNLRVCEGQRPADAVADFLLSNGMHDENFLPFDFEFFGLLDMVCASLYSPNQVEKKNCNSNKMAHKFLNDSTKYVTIHFQDEKDGSDIPEVVYFREGYSGVVLSECLCTLHICSLEQKAGIEQYISKTLRLISV